MARKPPGDGKSDPPLPHDHDLWHQVTRTVKPLKNRQSSAAAPSDRSASHHTLDDAEPQRSVPETRAPKRPRPAKPSRPAAPAPALKPMTGIDSRTSRRLVRGRIDIDARIDLHGHSRDAARVALLRFFASSVSRGDRTVLVITGKGNAPYTRHTLHGYNHIDTPEREGILRRAFRHWLDEPEFRALVSGYQPAHPRHGGGGAFYVRLRRQGRF